MTNDGDSGDLYATVHIEFWPDRLTPDADPSISPPPSVPRVPCRPPHPGRAAGHTAAAAGIEHSWRVELDSAPAPRLCLGRLESGLYVDGLVQVGETTALTDPLPLDLDLDAARLLR
ncbi:hypothetical protein ABTZ03_43395 [Kitasatospora sp. NPDC096077]|uniref:hypothetical protein n=1 Tax=Kitasatospora sp. NPDC096077 TaxID=3155544 RepID=UPI00331D0CD6